MNDDDPVTPGRSAKTHEDDGDSSPPLAVLRLRTVLRQYLTALNGVEQIIELSRPHLPPLDTLEHSIDTLAVERGVSLTEEQHREIKKVMLELLAAYRDLYGEMLDLNSQNADWTEAQELYHTRSMDIWSTSAEKLARTGAATSFVLDLLLSLSPDSNIRPPQEIFRSSLLVSTVSACEVFLGHVIRAFLTSRPQALSGTEIRFQFSDIAQFDSIESLRDHHIERQVESVIRQGGIDDWMKWFQTKIKIDFAQVTTNAEKIREIFQRRHVHVHNDGQVSDLYIAKMGGAGRTNVEVGEHLEVDEDYLLNAVDHLRSFGIALALTLARKLSREDEDGRPMEEFESYVSNLGYGFLRREKYALVVELSELLTEGTGEAERKIIFQVNQWIARKKMGDRKVTTEVSAWDTSALYPTYKLAKMALLGNIEPAHELALELIKNGVLSEEAYLEWPLLEEVRTNFPGTGARKNRPADGPLQVQEGTSQVQVPAQAAGRNEHPSEPTKPNL
ncbi:hypothetical protein [Micromonospora tulbaghiae]|uniref:hypothetical protein n=1 Tax=Micromonospora tulbaghiae TaxID=479978 RepID=UPI0036C71E6E